MNAKKFSEAMGELDDKYVSEAVSYKANKSNNWVKWGAMAACLCVVIVGGAIFAQNNNSVAPNPSPVQIANPIITVNSVAEMEQYLDFNVPLLDKSVEAYSVIVTDSYPTMGQVDYADGSKFRVQYGNEDISGIYGGALVETQDVDGVKVKYCKYTDTTYAIWEENGFSFSYIYIGDGDAEVKTLIQQFK